MYAHQSISSVHRLGSKLFDRPSYIGYSDRDMNIIMTAGVHRQTDRQTETRPLLLLLLLLLLRQSIDRTTATDQNKFGRKLNHFIDNDDVMAK